MKTKASKEKGKTSQELEVGNISTPKMRNLETDSNCTVKALLKFLEHIMVAKYKLPLKDCSPITVTEEHVKNNAQIVRTAYRPLKKNTITACVRSWHTIQGMTNMIARLQGLWRKYCPQAEEPII